jgi:2-polyprenyl-3-methyl-5-hydroxy-6-metoxy-1,4-benzoquinol methylase
MRDNMTCDLCNGKKYIELFKVSGKKDYDSPYKKDNIYTIVKCNNCGLVYTKDDLSLEELSNIYSEGYFTGRDERGYKKYIEKHENSFKNKFFNFIYRYQNHPGVHIKLVKKYVKNKGNLLEIGCAAGFFLEVARKKGWNVTGIELSEYASNYAREKLGLNVFTGKIEDLLKNGTIKKEQFDVVTLWATLEHIAVPSKLFESINYVLKLNGYLFFTTINFDSKEAKEQGKNWASIRPPKHLYYFTEATIKKYLEKYGFEIIQDADYTNKQMIIAARKTKNFK